MEKTEGLCLHYKCGMLNLGYAEQFTTHILLNDLALSA
jgi:hypothetical protein